ncbi:hypothetical protein BC829DRAFT_30233 [Chytridium lagenaria]|nr:hypothetical protein BC829DRAFT_30233 [Chytridium lagenaria]
MQILTSPFLFQHVSESCPGPLSFSEDFTLDTHTCALLSDRQGGMVVLMARGDPTPQNYAVLKANVGQRDGGGPRTGESVEPLWIFMRLLPLANHVIDLSGQCCSDGAQFTQTDALSPGDRDCESIDMWLSTPTLSANTIRYKFQIDTTKSFSEEKTVVRLR